MDTGITIPLSSFAQSLTPVGRVLEDPDYHVWGCSPIYGPDGRVHVFYSRWPNAYNHGGWVAACEIAHAVADSPEGPYETLGVILKGRGGKAWDSWSIHNPTIHKVGDQYALFYMGTDGSNLGVTLEEVMAMSEEDFDPYLHKLVNTKRVGLALADNLNGPWTRVGEEPCIVPSDNPLIWDSFCTSNPTYLHHPSGKHWLYYKAWDQGTAEAFNGNRKYGLAVADQIEGPYTKLESNPVISFEHLGPDIQCEDGYVWMDGGRYYMILRDMGVYNHEYGLLLSSEDGLNWGNLEIAYLNATSYFDEALPGLEREGRFERPQILMKDARPDYLFCAYQGGAHLTCSGVVLKINPT